MSRYCNEESFNHTDETFLVMHYNGIEYLLIPQVSILLLSSKAKYFQMDQSI